MGLLSLGRKKEEAAPDDSAFVARAAEDASAARPKARKKTRAADPIDPVLPEKQRARRRLVGAVALVLAAVIGLPMILDPEPKPLASDISIDIPSKDKARPAAAAGVPAAAALDQSEEIVPDSAAAASQAKAAGAPTSTAGAPTSVAGAPAAAAGAAAAAAPAKAESDKPQAEAKADGKGVDAKPAPAKAADAKPAVPAEARSETKPQAKADTKSEHAKGDAKAESTAAAHRADDARAKAILDGRDGAKSDTYMLQVAALASPDKVRELQNKLKAAGIKTQTQKVATASGERIRVRVGPVAGRAEAEKMKARLNKLGYNGTLVPA